MTVNAFMNDTETASPERIIDAVVAAEALLRSAGVTDVPRLEAEALLSDLLGVERADLVASYSQPVENPSEYFSRIKRRTEGEPVPYITGKKEFMGIAFSVDSRALVPRPETETLVDYVMETIQTDDAATIIDVATGSGCIAVSLALLLSHASLHATDISESALALARENAERHRVNQRITFHTGNVYSALPDSLRGCADAIVSNPPYISDAEYSALDGGIRDFEPPIALRGGVDGLDIFRKIAAGSADFLTRDGMLAVEIGENQAEKAAEILKRAEIFSQIKIVRDLSGRARVITARKTR